MRNTKLILAMLAGCTLMSGAAFAQDAASKPSPTPAATAATPMHSSSDSMKSNDSMKGNENGSMKSTHKKHKKSSAASSGSSTEPAKSSTSGM
jgi:hypothetical protein